MRRKKASFNPKNDIMIEKPITLKRAEIIVSLIYCLFLFKLNRSCSNGSVIPIRNGISNAICK
jgi:hypothetical protein